MGKDISILNVKANHWCKIVSNIDDEIAFFTKVLGYKIRTITKNRTDGELACAWNTAKVDINLAMLETSNDRVELIEINGIADGINENICEHYCYKVEDIKEIYDYFNNKGYNFLSTPQTIRNSVKIVFLKKDDNSVIEFLEVKSEINPRTRKTIEV